MGQLSDLIAEAKVREIQRNETALAQQLAAPAAELDDDAQWHLVPFIEWATNANVRYCPALPTTVGSYILAASASGIKEKQILATVAAIERLHDSVGLPSPCATTPARYAFSQVVKSEPPRSWTKEEKLMWATLPPEIRSVIARREHSREKETRRLQNEVAEMKRLSETAADQKPVEVNNERT
jgi:hypothetical protein